MIIFFLKLFLDHLLPGVYDRTRLNEQFYANLIDEEAKNITFSLVNDGMAIKENQYRAYDLEQRLGQITNYHSLGDISNIFHIPVPFLEEENFYKRDKEDELFYKVKSEKMLEQRNRFRDMFAQLNRNILTLIENDTQ